ncbi:MAG: FAD-dependent oxidoreductase, partial [Pyrinomonadaceae bacterium]|nr:FAD-dependent oxidoreductase [Pyrinomonadaceae bacterium]
IGRTAYLKGKLYRRGTVFKKHPYGLKDMEAKVLPPTLYGMNLRLMGNEVRKKIKTLADFDKMSLADALRKNGVSKKAIELINISLNYNSVETVSAGGVLYDAGKRRTAGTIPIKITGGNDSIPRALAASAREAGVKFLLRSKVKKISQNDCGVKVTYENGVGEIQTLEADKFVCTIPFSVLKKVEFSPALPAQKMKAINGLDYTQNTKVHLQTKYAEWDKRSLGSSIWTDTPIERIFSPVATLGDERAIFSVWTDGDGSKVLENMPEDERMTFAQGKFEEILPFMKGSVERTHTLSWSQDEFAKGAYSHFKVGQLSSIGPHIRTAVGNLHFAGEHTAEKAPGMEGALESAERVVAEIAET